MYVYIYIFLFVIMKLLTISEQSTTKEHVTNFKCLINLINSNFVVKEQVQ